MQPRQALEKAAVSYLSEVPFYCARRRKKTGVRLWQKKTLLQPGQLLGWSSPELPLPARGTFRSFPFPHSLAQGASSFGLLFHPLPQWVGIVPIDVDLTVHVKLHTVVFSKCLNLSVVPRLLRKLTEGRGTPSVQGPRREPGQPRAVLVLQGSPCPTPPTYLFSKLVAGKAQDA